MEMAVNFSSVAVTKIQTSTATKVEYFANHLVMVENR
jgi:hypothetical protein